MRVPELKELLRSRGLRVSGRKAELVGRLLEEGGDAGVPTVDTAQPPVPSSPELQDVPNIPLDGVVIEAGKS